MTMPQFSSLDSNSVHEKEIMGSRGLDYIFILLLLLTNALGTRGISREQNKELSNEIRVKIVAMGQRQSTCK